MKDTTRISVPSRSTIFTHQIGSPNGSPEDSSPENASSILMHDTEALDDPTMLTGTYTSIGRPGSDRNDEGAVASTEPSSTCVSQNWSLSLDGPFEPLSDRTSSSSRLNVKRKELSGSSRHHRFPMFRDWKWEILSILTSLGLLAGIFITLGRYNEGKQPEWPYHININSLISVLTAVIIAQLGFVLAEGMCNSLVAFPLSGPGIQYVCKSLCI